MLKKKNLILIISLCTLILSMVIASIPITFQDPADTKLYVSPASIVGPPPGIGESFMVDVYIENVTDLASWMIGLAWNASILNCTSWTSLFNTAVMGPIGDYLAMEGYINNTKGVVEPYSYSLLKGKTPKSGNDSLAQVEFIVLDHGFTWINLTYVKIKSLIGGVKIEIPVDVTNGTFSLFAISPAAPVASFTSSPSAPQVNQIVTFNASASVLGWNGTADVLIANYTWDFDDVNVTTVTTPIIYHTYTAEGTYTVNLTVTCEEDPMLISMGLTSNSTWQDVTITGPVHDVAVTSVTPSPTEVTAGESVAVNVTVKNEGEVPENFTVTAYYDSTAIDTQTVTNLLAGNETTLTFTWGTTGVEEGDYTIKAVASTVVGETDTADNTLIDGTVTVKAPATKLYVSPASIVGPPPGIGESFMVDVYIENVTDLASWMIGLAWNASILNCTSWTSLFNTAVMGPIGDYLAMEGYINNTKGVVEPYSYSLIKGKTPKSGSDSLAQVEFQVLDYGFTWINLTYVKIKSLIGGVKTEIPVDVTNGTFSLFAISPAAPVASFTSSPSAPQVNQIITFNASASVPGWNGTADVPIANYTWDFDDGNVTTVTTPIIYHTYTAEGTYTVNLTVTCEEDPMLISMGLTSNSTWQDVTITAVPVVPVHDVAVTSVTPSPTEVTAEESVTVTVIVKNEGNFTETFTVTAYYDSTAIDTQTVTNLASGATETLTFTWNTTDVEEDDYTIKAVASTVAGETDTADNTLIDGTVTVKVSAPAEIPWLWIILAIIIIVAVIIIAYWMIRRRKTE